MLRVTVDLDDNAMGDILIRPLNNTTGSGLSKYAYVIIERSILGEEIEVKEGIVEAHTNILHAMELLHHVLSQSVRNKALLPTTIYEKTIIDMMKAELVCS